MNFGFLVFDGLEELDLVGPWEMIQAWSKYEGGPEQCFTVSHSTNSITCAKGLKLLPDLSFENCPDLDFLLIPGGVGVRQVLQKSDYLDFVRYQSEKCQQILSVCTGSLLLQAAGLLDGKKVATHWSALDDLRAFPDIDVVESRFVNEGNIWTAAGVSSGMDMALEFIASQAGQEVAGNVQLYTEYYPAGKKFGSASNASQLPKYIRMY